MDIGELILNYDPVSPDARFVTTATALAAALAKPKLPKPVPWPDGFAPFATPLGTPSSSDPLPKCDALVVTWTAAEARTLASLFTPGVQIENWGRYAHNLAVFLPKVTGPRAPFNTGRAMYYHVLGLYHPCQIGQAKVLCFKSGLHMAYDGPAMPVKDLWQQIIQETGAKLVITTGTGGGIGGDMKLGDVIIGEAVRFDCTTKFKGQPYSQKSYPSTVLPQDTFASVGTAMLEPNADVLKPINPDPVKLVFPGSRSVAKPVVVTTDFFAYDDTLNTHHLQGLGNVCDMGDAVLGLALEGEANPPKWVAIRNASDPQMDGSLPQKERDDKAGNIYMKYGLYTTVGSVIASWAVILKTVPAAARKGTAPVSMMALAAQTDVQRPTPQPAPGEVLLALAVCAEIESRAIVNPDDAVSAALNSALAAAKVPSATSEIAWRQLTFTDEIGSHRVLSLAQVAHQGGDAFRGSYLFEGGTLLARQEFVSHV